MLTTFSFSSDTVGFLMEGKISRETILDLNTAIEEKLARFGKINLYLEDSNISSFELPAILDQISFKFNHRNQFNKIALVTDRKWIHWCAHVDDAYMRADVKPFDVKNRLQAIAWIADDLHL